MNQSDRTMPSAVCERTASIGMDAPCSLSGLGENGYCSNAVKRISKDYRGFTADMVGRQVTDSGVS